MIFLLFDSSSGVVVARCICGSGALEKGFKDRFKLGLLLVLFDVFADSGSDN